jgi:hypothetical protein
MTTNSAAELLTSAEAGVDAGLHSLREAAVELGATAPLKDLASASVELCAQLEQVLCVLRSQRCRAETTQHQSL